MRVSDFQFQSQDVLVSHSIQNFTMPLVFFLSLPSSVFHGSALPPYPSSQFEIIEFYIIRAQDPDRIVFKSRIWQCHVIQKYNPY